MPGWAPSSISTCSWLSSWRATTEIARRFARTSLCASPRPWDASRGPGACGCGPRASAGLRPRRAASSWTCCSSALSEASTLAAWRPLRGWTSTTSRVSATSPWPWRWSSAWRSSTWASRRRQGTTCLSPSASRKPCAASCRRPSSGRCLGRRGTTWSASSSRACAKTPPGRWARPRRSRSSGRVRCIRPTRVLLDSRRF
mmetsp:Transcript_156572/g.502571  ORF Transcript_156572/g.502571 Transcript_156572/m.502571 type:complete len:200 (+) Transcript_156572:1266-1865(+)